MDIYSYPGSDVLKNKLNLRSQNELNKFERRLSGISCIELRSKHFSRFSFFALKLFHKELLQDIYAWAGKPRTVDISKGNTMFCRAEFIDMAAEDIFDKLTKNNNLKGLDSKEFCVAAADLFGDLNALHPFREGNGRTIREFIFHLAKNAGYELDLNFADKSTFMQASIESAHLNNSKIQALMEGLIKPLYNV